MTLNLLFIALGYLCHGAITALSLYGFFKAVTNRWPKKNWLIVLVIAGLFGLYSYNRDQSHQAALQEIMGKRTYERYQSAEQQAAEDKAEEQARESE